MGHPIPKELRGEERYFSIPVLNIHFNKKGVIYNGIATGIAALIGKVTNTWVFGTLLVILNLIAYPLAHVKLPRNKFDGGNVGLDIYLYRWVKYNFFNKNLYLRRGGR
ncbi:MAG: hypothetical protein H0Z24_03380 [Thermosipho sp. (in: Bacteria)]|nr:hypothetical protein [Thermosipho sp. (in: thermotogales)]